MTLHEAIESLAALPEDAVIFAQRINGSFDPNSPTVLVTLTADELREPVREIAAIRAPGFEYFLEVSVAREALHDWLQQRRLDIDPEAATHAIIHYATHDAFPQQ
jgi:hypothetical protein